MTTEQYQSLIAAYVDGALPTEDFEREFLRAFKAEPAEMDGELFRVLDDLFGAVDAYSPDCRPGEETAFLISEDRLRREATHALDRLNRLLGPDRVGRTAG
jgi:hypothetical protein